MTTKWALAPGHIVGGRYEIGREIGRGGMGVVYQSVDRKLQRDVALKFLEPEHITDSEAVERFQREAMSAGRIGHENICDVRDLGATDDGAPYIVMELLEGEPFATTMERDAQLAPDRALGITIQVLSALEAAHQAGIVHRDMKPENVFLALGAGGRERVKLLDFGISKYLGDSSELRLTKTGFVMGSPYYMSPEQARGRHDVDHRTDVWSVGVMLFEALTGSLPFLGDNYNEVMARIITEEPPDPRVITPSIPDGLAEVVLRALSKEPEDRYNSAAEFASALATATGRFDLVERAFGSSLPPPSPAPRPSSHPGRRSRRGLWLGLFALLVVTLGSAVGAVLVVGLPERGAVQPANQEPAPPVVADTVAPRTPAADSPVQVPLVGLPDGAAVTFDGAPVTGGRLTGPAGRMGVLEVTVEGYEPLRIELVLAAGLRLDLADRLQLATPPEVAAVDAGADRADRSSKRRGGSVRREGRERPAEGGGRSGERGGYVHGRGGSKVTREYSDR